MAPVAFPMTWVATGPAAGMAQPLPLLLFFGGFRFGHWRCERRTCVGLPVECSESSDLARARRYRGRNLFRSRAQGPRYFRRRLRSRHCFAVNGGPPGIDDSFVVTYAGAVALDGNPPNNDLYAKLIINFPTGFGAIDFEFTQETDRNIVPEPASWLLVAMGLAAIVACLAELRNAAIRGRPPVEMIRTNAPKCSSDVVSGSLLS